MSSLLLRPRKGGRSSTSSIFSSNMLKSPRSLFSSARVGDGLSTGEKDVKESSSMLVERLGFPEPWGDGEDWRRRGLSRRAARGS